jgi:hypothetical protein
MIVYIYLNLFFEFYFKMISFIAKTLIRDDKVMNIKYPDNSILTIHEDNTKVFTFPDHLKYLVEHESKINFLKNII